MVQLVKEEQTENRSRNTERDRSGRKFVVRRNGTIFHVVDMTKPIRSVSCLCENGVEAHLAKEILLEVR